MIKQDMLKALEIIVDKQYKDDKHFGCAPVEVQIGYTNKDNIVMNGLLIKECPPVIVEELGRAGYNLSVGHGGMHVDKF